MAIKQTTLTSIRTNNPEVSPQVAEVIEKALKVDIEERYQTGHDFKRALLDASETINRDVAAGDVTVTPPPADATVAARDIGRTTSGSRPAAQPAGRGIPWGWIIGGAAVGVVGIVVVAVLLSGLLFNGSNGGTAAEPSATSAQAAVLPEENTPEAAAPTATETQAPLATTEAPAEPTATTGPAATPTGGGGLIAFASTRSGGDPQIFLYDLASGEVSQLTNIGGGACQPSWAPDGQSMAVVVPCPQNQQRYDGSSLFEVSLADGELTPLPSSPIGDYDPDWSPVENKIVFTSVRDFDRPQILSLIHI